MPRARNWTGQLRTQALNVLDCVANQQPALDQDDDLARLFAKADKDEFTVPGTGLDSAPTVPHTDDVGPALLERHVCSFLPELRRDPKAFFTASGHVPPEARQELVVEALRSHIEDWDHLNNMMRRRQLLSAHLGSVPKLRGLAEAFAKGGNVATELLERCAASVRTLSDAEWQAAQWSIVAGLREKRRWLPPCEGSARVAAFYPAARQRTVAGLDERARALVQGCLRRHDMSLLDEGGMQELPLHFRRACSGAIDVEGELLACCGHVNHGGANFVGFYGSLGKVLAGRRVDYGEVEREVSFVRRKKCGQVNAVLADEGHGMVWSVDSGDGVVRGHSSATKALAGTAALPKAAVKSAEGYWSFAYGMCRCEDALLASAATGSIYSFSIPGILAGRGAGARAVKVFDGRLAQAGSMCAVGSGRVVVAPCDGEDAPVHTSMRVLDLASGKVVQVLAGHAEPPAVRRQHCGPNTLLSFDRSKAAKLWDLRTGTPQLSLPGGFVAAIAVPLGAGGCAAITSGGDECLRVWDLRQHVGAACLYKMATGNLIATDLAWSAPLNSLFAGTESQHASSGRRREEDGYDGRWPERAVHDPSEWQLPFSHGRRAQLLLYPFGTADIDKKQAPARRPEGDPVKAARLRRLPPSEDDFHHRSRPCDDDSEDEVVSDDGLLSGLLSEGEEAGTKGEEAPLPKRRRRVKGPEAGTVTQQ